MTEFEGLTPTTSIVNSGSRIGYGSSRYSEIGKFFLYNKNSFYKVINKDGTTLQEKTSLGTSGDLSSQVIDTIVKDRENNLIILLDDITVDIDQSNPDEWGMFKQNDLIYRILDLNSGQLGDIQRLNSDFFEFELAVDKDNK